MGQRGFETLNKVPTTMYWNNMWDNVDDYTKIFLQTTYINNFLPVIFTEKFSTNLNYIKKKKIDSDSPKKLSKNKYILKNVKYIENNLNNQTDIPYKNNLTDKFSSNVFLKSIVTDNKEQKLYDNRITVSSKIWILYYSSCFYILFYTYKPEKPLEDYKNYIELKNKSIKNNLNKQKSLFEKRGNLINFSKSFKHNPFKFLKNRQFKHTHNNLIVKYFNKKPLIKNNIKLFNNYEILPKDNDYLEKNNNYGYFRKFKVKRNSFNSLKNLRIKSWALNKNNTTFIEPKIKFKNKIPYELKFNILN